MSETNGIFMEGGAQTDRYNVKMTTYPADLFGNGAETYARSWVLININVQKTSKDYNQAGVFYEELQEDELAKRNLVPTEARATFKNHTGDSLASTVTTTAAASAGFSKLRFAELFSERGAYHIGEVAGAFVKGAATGALLTIPLRVAGTATRETKRLKAAIQLPMPNQLMTAYGMEYGQPDMMMFDLMARGTSAVLDALSGKEFPTGSNVNSAFAGAALGLAGSVNSGAISSATGLASNSKKEMIFQGVNFRSFTVDYFFYPKTAAEAIRIRDIVQLLKYHMHPEFLADDRFTFVYPSEFDITFFTDAGTENEFIFKVGTCVLTNMSVNYTPDGLWVTHNNGVPNMMRVTLEFKELGIHTKDSIKQGF